MSTQEEIAKRLLDRCEKIEQSRRIVRESLERAEAAANGDGDPSHGGGGGGGPREDLTPQTYRQQIDQCRRALVSTQENARLKQEKLETEISDLNKLKDTLEKKVGRLEPLEGQLATARRTLLVERENSQVRQAKAESELELLRKELSELKKERKRLVQSTSVATEKATVLERELSFAKSWAKRAREHVIEVNNENNRLKSIVLSLKKEGGDGDGDVVPPPQSSSSSPRTTTSTSGNGGGGGFKLWDDQRMFAAPGRRNPLSLSPRIGSGGNGGDKPEVGKKAIQMIRNWGQHMADNIKQVDDNLKSKRGAVGTPQFGNLAAPPKPPRSAPETNVKENTNANANANPSPREDTPTPDGKSPRTDSSTSSSITNTTTTNSSTTSTSSSSSSSSLSDVETISPSEEDTIIKQTNGE